MNKELREQVVKKFNVWRSAYYYLLLYGKPMGREHDNLADELITLIANATLDKAKDAINCQADYVSSENGGYINYSECIEAIEQLREGEG